MPHRFGAPDHFHRLSITPRARIELANTGSYRAACNKYNISAPQRFSGSRGRLVAVLALIFDIAPRFHGVRGRRFEGRASRNSVGALACSRAAHLCHAAGAHALWGPEARQDSGPRPCPPSRPPIGISRAQTSRAGGARPSASASHRICAPLGPAPCLRPRLLAPRSRGGLHDQCPLSLEGSPRPSTLPGRH